ncbi:hypothetical protein [Brevibacillus sp. NRS-1366]|uniref:hypothetical protein n=1 Tax=Brevibacillus sp. NRS-1366 TaxID=3233899 RepID=UPI003D1C21A7
MKRLAIGLIAVTLGLNIVPLNGTLSFLTSEKKQVSAVSTGTNEDVFVTETEQIVLKTKVAKRVKVKRTKNADGSSSETTESRTSIEEGVQRISFVPQRDHLNLGVENITVTGLSEGEITIEQVEKMEAEKGIVFRIAHNRQMVDRKTKTEKGELHVTALGGFYSFTIPIIVRTTYSSSTDISEEGPSGQSPQPDGTPEPSAPTEPSAPPPADTDHQAGSSGDAVEREPVVQEESEEQSSSQDATETTTSTDGKVDAKAGEEAPTSVETQD